MGALDGVVVLDFTQLVPGPLASLRFAQAGAQVVKVEPPGGSGAAVGATFAEAGFASDVFPARVPALRGAP